MKNPSCAEAQQLSPDWNALKEIAGEPAPRVFAEKERLFGAQAPLLRLWHDSAAWHPFAMQVFLLIEEMQVPHIRAPVPMNFYLKPGEQISPEFQKLGGDFPIIQLASGRPSVGGKGIKWSAPLREKSQVDIFRKLHQLFPQYALLPQTPKRRAFAENLLDRYSKLQSALYGVIGSGGSKAHGSYISAMDEFNAAWSDSRSLRSFGDDGDGVAQHFGGSLEGPFLFGERPCAVDCLLLPLLERCEANVPHPLLGKAPHLAIERWPALARLQLAARTPGVCAYGELGTDAKTTVAIRMSVTGMLTQLPSLQTMHPQNALTNASKSNLDARRDAASRLISNQARITGFACSGAGIGRSRQVQRPKPDEAVLSSTNAALKGVAQILLIELPASLEATAAGIAVGLRATYIPNVLQAAAVNLVFLAENTGVPRDMVAASAFAFREHLYLMAALLHR